MTQDVPHSIGASVAIPGRIRHLTYADAVQYNQDHSLERNLLAHSLALFADCKVAVGRFSTLLTGEGFIFKCVRATLPAAT